MLILANRSKTAAARPAAQKRKPVPKRLSLSSDGSNSSESSDSEDEKENKIVGSEAGEKKEVQSEYLCIYTIELKSILYKKGIYLCEL